MKIHHNGYCSDDGGYDAPLYFIMSASKNEGELNEFNKTL